MGRDTELERLRAAQRAQPPPVVVVHGEPGAGKTRLAAVLAAEAELALWGTCYDGYPYGGWAEALGGYLRGVPPDRIEAELGPTPPSSRGCCRRPSG